MVVSPKVQLQSEEKEHLSLNTSSFSASHVFLVFLAASDLSVFVDWLLPSIDMNGRNNFFVFPSRSVFVITCCHSVLLCLTARQSLWWSRWLSRWDELNYECRRPQLDEVQRLNDNEMIQFISDSSVLSNQTAVDYSVYMGLFGGHQQRHDWQ